VLPSRTAVGDVRRPELLAELRPQLRTQACPA
jgi:hypothetical protein